ncbi:type I restriction enzyme, S subunit [Epibacterium ulvae]|uniref:Type I restriction enzyme, S subunit n=1 Tax=Epibacterium ulvae TaxID=1156985 RepID=A0A1G5PWF6_9RHOB|nr:restriction endonuclease subunit S [Epibacterium ulvae]SCZ53863.1 type I restriction enzyme, S subunit [Epibacterium ulvae]
MTDVNQLITDQLDTWTAATEKKSSAGRGNGGGVSLHGIKKLRELILELAVRGKLVPNDTTDHSSEMLLDGFRHRRMQGIKAKRYKKQNLGEPLSASDQPFDVPASWSWSRMGEIGFVFNGNSVSARAKAEKFSAPDGLPFIATKNVGYGFEPLDYDVEAWIPVNEPKFKVALANTPLICSEGGSAGKKCGLTDRDVCFGNKLFACEFYGEFVSEFLLAWYQCPSFFSQFSKKMTGIIGGISLAKFLRLPVPVPPISEQQRIVAKLNELMGLCDVLQRQAEHSQKAHQTLVETCLATLTNSQSPEDLTKNWTRIEAHFDTLFTTEESVQALEAAIIELGVTGLLVPQIEADEPATLLLKRVAKDIAAYSKLNKVRPVKPAKVVEQESQAERLPSGWVETRLSSLFRVVTDGDHQAPPRASDGVAFLTIGNISSGQLNFEGCRRVPDDYYKGLPAYRTPGLGDILYTVVGATYGRPVLVETEEQFCVQRHIAILKPSVELDVDYLVWMLKSAWVYNQAREGITGSAQPTLALKPLRNFLVLLPPRAQQERISAKIKQLHQLTARLRERISVSTETQVSLANTITSKIH